MIMRLFASLIAALAAFSAPALADTVFINLNDLPTVPGTGGQYVAGYTGAGGMQLVYGTQTPIYLLDGLNLPAGTIVDAGILTVSPTFATDQYGDYTIFAPIYSLTGAKIQRTNFAFGCSFYFGNHCDNIPTIPSAQVHLLFDDPSTIQISWVGFGFIQQPIASAVPEPSTWAMLLIGFAGVSFMTHRRRKVAPLV
jgi:hypothetical protein